MCALSFYYLTLLNYVGHRVKSKTVNKLDLLSNFFQVIIKNFEE